MAALPALKAGEPEGLVVGLDPSLEMLRLVQGKGVARVHQRGGLSLYGLIRLFGAQLDPSLMSGGELSGHAITTSGVRILTPFFNVCGTVTLVGGAAYSAWIFWRKRTLLHRAVGNILIAVGAMAPAFSGLFSRFGLGGYLYLSELIGAILMFMGFIRATSPMKRRGPR